MILMIILQLIIIILHLGVFTKVCGLLNIGNGRTGALGSDIGPCRNRKCCDDATVATGPTPKFLKDGTVRFLVAAETRGQFTRSGGERKGTAGWHSSVDIVFGPRI